MHMDPHVCTCDNHRDSHIYKYMCMGLSTWSWTYAHMLMNMHGGTCVHMSLHVNASKPWLTCIHAHGPHMPAHCLHVNTWITYLGQQKPVNTAESSGRSSWSSAGSTQIPQACIPEGVPETASSHICPEHRELTDNIPASKGGGNLASNALLMALKPWEFGW